MYPWSHRHVILESREMIAGFHNYIKIVRNFRQIIMTDCPYGPNCPVAFPNHINFWATPYLTNPVSRPLNPPQLSPQIYQPPVLLSNDLVEFNTPPYAFPGEMRMEVTATEINNNNRNWEATGYGNHLDSSRTLKFKLMSYNVLSQVLLNSNQMLYNSCRRENLVWEARWEKIFNEVVTLNPDIFCLQEVQASHLSYYARFQSIGYFGVFKRKTRNRADGCAVFYKYSMFEMIDKVAVEFRKEEIPILRADSIGVIVKLVPHASPNTHLVVATTHLIYMPDEAPTRLAQMRFFLNEIEKFAYDEMRGTLPVILTGDFNAMPHSNVIKFLEEGQIRIPVEESLEAIGLGETNIEMNIQAQFNDGAIASNGDTVSSQPRYKLARHGFNLSSVYEIGPAHERWPTVDHIYFTSDLSVVERLSPPPAHMRRTIPNEIYGSDHMSIAAVFEIGIE